VTFDASGTESSRHARSVKSTYVPRVTDWLTKNISLIVGAGIDVSVEVFVYFRKDKLNILVVDELMNNERAGRGKLLSNSMPLVCDLPPYCSRSTARLESR
jgi:hypothetical protein